MQIGSDPEESEKEVKMNMGQEEEEEEEEKGEKMKGSKEKEEGVKENIEKIMEDANGVKDGPIRSSLWPTYLKVSSIFKQINKALVKIQVSLAYMVAVGIACKKRRKNKNSLERTRTQPVWKN